MIFLGPSLSLSQAYPCLEDFNYKRDYGRMVAHILDADFLLLYYY